MSESSQSDNGQLALELGPARGWRSAREEHCAKCGAPPGEPCRTATGSYAYREHDARRLAARFAPVRPR